MALSSDEIKGVQMIRINFIQDLHMILFLMMEMEPVPALEMSCIY